MLIWISAGVRGISGGDRVRFYLDVSHHLDRRCQRAYPRYPSRRSMNRSCRHLRLRRW